MPELPEVETTKRGITPYLLQQQITKVIIREHRFRWPIPQNLAKIITNQTLVNINRRGKYLLLQTEIGSMILHLGMSGRLCIIEKNTPANKHDHVDLQLSNDLCLRFTDPRRFGCLLWSEGNPLNHPLLAKLGPEPLENKFNADYLYDQTKTRKTCIKQVIMNSHIVVGVGNIYANEALFLAGIHPKRAAHRLTHNRCEKLCGAIKHTLSEAIKQGGTTLRDFRNSEGKPGYFQQSLHVYGREGCACTRCGKFLKALAIGQRSTVYCSTCQK